MNASGFIGQSTLQVFVSNFSTFKEDVAPAVEAAGKLTDIGNPFDNDEAVSSQADVVAVHTLIAALRRLGQLTAIYTVRPAHNGDHRFKHREIEQLLRRIKLGNLLVPCTPTGTAS